MRKLTKAIIRQAREQYAATMTPENRIVRDDTITPFCIGMGLAGFSEVSGAGGCATMKRCQHCKGNYSTKYSKGGAFYWACPHCNTIEKDATTPGKINMVYWADDPDAVALVCEDCGARGAQMSRNWNWDESTGAWEPQPRHIPDCPHFRAERDAAVGTPFRVRKNQTGYVMTGNGSRV